MTAAERLQRIKAGIRHGDYRPLRDGGESLVFAHARELGITGTALIHRWAAGDSRVAADKATCGKCGGRGTLDDDTTCERCSGTGDESYVEPKYEPGHDFSSPDDGPDEPDPDDEDADQDEDDEQENDDDETADDSDDEDDAPRRPRR